MIAGVIFIIVFCFLRYSLTLSSVNLPLKSSSITTRQIFLKLASQPPARVQLQANRQQAASQPSASRHPAVSQLTASQPASQKNPSYLYKCMTKHIFIRVI